MRSSPAGAHLYIYIYYYVSSALCAESKRESIICTPLLTGSIVFNFLIDDSVTVCVKLPSMHSSLSAPVINENAHPAESHSFGHYPLFCAGSFPSAAPFKSLFTHGMPSACLHFHLRSFLYKIVSIGLQFQHLGTHTK